MRKHCDRHLTAYRGKLNRGSSLGGLPAREKMERQTRQRTRRIGREYARERLHCVRHTRFRFVVRTGAIRSLVITTVDGANLHRSRNMTKITVYHFEVWDSVNDQMVRSKRMGTPDAIKNTAHGREVGQGMDVDVADVGTEIPGFTVRNYRPPGSQ
jgi:hypothetical protein